MRRLTCCKSAAARLSSCSHAFMRRVRSVEIYALVTQCIYHSQACTSLREVHPWGNLTPAPLLYRPLESQHSLERSHSQAKPPFRSEIRPFIVLPAGPALMPPDTAPGGSKMYFSQVIFDIVLEPFFLRVKLAQEASWSQHVRFWVPS